MKVKLVVLTGKLDHGALGLAGARTIVNGSKGVSIEHLSDGVMLRKGAITVFLPYIRIDYIQLEEEVKAPAKK